MEIDMAKDVAAAMNVDLELVPVQSSNRMQFLEQGKIDMMIATMSDRVDRRKIVGITQPNYYTSGTNIMSPKALGLSSWEDLRGKPVCGKQGAFYNKIVADRYGAKIIAFTGNAEAKQAAIRSASPGFTMILPSCPIFPRENLTISRCLWLPKTTTLGTRRSAGRERLHLRSFHVRNHLHMHQSGRLIELEQKHGIQSTNYLVIQKYRNKDWLEGK